MTKAEKKQQKQERLVLALRDNLKRRKQTIQPKAPDPDEKTSDPAAGPSPVQKD